MIADREAGPIVRRIFEMAAEGVPKTHIARKLNEEGIPNPVTLRKERGERFYRKQVGENHEPLVSREIFNKVNRNVKTYSLDVQTGTE